MISSRIDRDAAWRVGICVIWGIALLYAAGGESRGDEYVHFDQVRRFLTGEGGILRDTLTTIPVYHWLVMFAMKLTGAESLGAARAISGLSALLAIAGFVRLRRAVLGRDDRLGGTQFALLPLMAPFAFLVYTDIPSLAAMLWATDASVRGRHTRAAALLVVAIGMRQNNVYWLSLLVALATTPALRERGWASLRETLPPLWPYAVPVALFAGYWAWNGSISYANAQSRAHPDTSLHVGNLYFMLYCAAILLPLQVLDGLRRFVVDAVARPWLIVVPAALFGVFHFAFVVDHPYNLIENAASWRNRVLELTLHSAAFKAAFGGIATLAGIGLAWQPLANVSARWLYPLAALFVSLSWLVEQRYYLIPLALFLAFREPLSRRAELATLALWCILAVFLFHGMISGNWYL